MRDIFLDGIVARNRALNGDVVVVQLLPPEQWKVNCTCLSLYNELLICNLPILSFGISFSVLNLTWREKHTSRECISQ